MFVKHYIACIIKPLGKLPVHLIVIILDVSERLIESRTEESSLRSGPSGSPGKLSILHCMLYSSANFSIDIVHKFILYMFNAVENEFLSFVSVKLDSGSLHLVENTLNTY